MAQRPLAVEWLECDFAAEGRMNGVLICESDERGRLIAKRSALPREELKQISLEAQGADGVRALAHGEGLL
jgi:hypothetical protein